jgi:hypothetical protein
METRPVNPLSLMTDVFVEFERLRQNLEGLRDALVETPGASHHHHELHAARGNCRRISDELRAIHSLLSLVTYSTAKPEPPSPLRSKPALVKP